jgi:hypothetical protein
MDDLFQETFLGVYYYLHELLRSLSMDWGITAKST